MKEKFLTQFIPKEFQYLLTTNKIVYKEINLKTAYLINIIHELLLKFYFNNSYSNIEDEIKFNLWSKLLKKKYGMTYNYYIDYLVEKQFIYFVSNYYKNMKSKTYKLNVNYIQNITRCKTSDNILLKKYSKDYLNKSFTEINNSSIDIDIRRKLVDDLYTVQIKYQDSIDYLNDLKEKNLICDVKYQKNSLSIENINDGNLFFKFDDYGRMHTNFTILKKEIRQNYLLIENSEIEEIDIKNSQPLFLSLFLKKEINNEILKNKEFILYNNLIKNGLLYDYIMDKCSEYVKDRNEAKLLIYRVFFGKNILKIKDNELFNKLFPNIYNYIKEYKQFNNNYKTLSHELQLLESNFIFNTVIKKIYEIDKNIKLITVHDSIIFKKKDKDIVLQIFNDEMNKLLNSI
jgi:hypothetical protein